MLIRHVISMLLICAFAAMLSAASADIAAAIIEAYAFAAADDFLLCFSAPLTLMMRLR